MTKIQERQMEELLGRIKDFQAQISAFERVEVFWDKIQEGYCKHCGEPGPGKCYCMMDE